MSKTVQFWIQQPSSKQGRTGQCYSHGACSHGIPHLLGNSNRHYHLHKHPHLILIQRKTIHSTTSNPVPSRSNFISSPNRCHRLSAWLLPSDTFACVCHLLHNTYPVCLKPSEHLIKRTNSEAPHPVFLSFLLIPPRRNYTVFIYISPPTPPKKQQFAVTHRCTILQDTE